METRKELIEKYFNTKEELNYNLYSKEYSSRVGRHINEYTGNCSKYGVSMIDTSYGAFQKYGRENVVSSIIESDDILIVIK